MNSFYQTQPPSEGRHGDGTPLAAAHREDLILHELDGEALIYDPRSAGTHRLNETAFLIWRLCDGQRTGLDIAHEVAAKYDISAAGARPHVDRMIVELAANELITLTSREKIE